MIDKVFEKIKNKLVGLDEKTNTLERKIEGVYSRLPDRYIKSVDLNEALDTIIVKYSNGNTSKYNIPKPVIQEKIDYVLDESLIKQNEFLRDKVAELQDHIFKIQIQAPENGQDGISITNVFLEDVELKIELSTGEILSAGKLPIIEKEIETIVEKHHTETIREITDNQIYDNLKIEYDEKIKNLFEKIESTESKISNDLNSLPIGIQDIKVIDNKIIVETIDGEKQIDIPIIEKQVETIVEKHHTETIREITDENIYNQLKNEYETLLNGIQIQHGKDGISVNDIILEDSTLKAKFSNGTITEIGKLPILEKEIETIVEKHHTETIREVVEYSKEIEKIQKEIQTFKKYVNGKIQQIAFSYGGGGGINFIGGDLTKYLGVKKLNLSVETNVLTVPCRSGNTFEVLLDQNVNSILFEDWPPIDISQRVVLYLQQDSTGNKIINTWPSNVKWSNGIIPTLSTSPNSIDCIVFDSFDSGQTIYGNLAGQNYQ